MFSRGALPDGNSALHDRTQSRFCAEPGASIYPSTRESRLGITHPSTARSMAARDVPPHPVRSTGSSLAYGAIRGSNLESLYANERTPPRSAGPLRTRGVALSLSAPQRWPSLVGTCCRIFRCVGRALPGVSAVSGTL